MHFFQLFASAVISHIAGIFKNTTGNISREYETQITPSGRTFAIWGVIYTYQLLWIIYTMTLLCRKSAGGFLYYSPPFLPFSFYFTYWLNLACNVSWLILWDRQYLSVTVPVLVATTIFLISSVAISMSGLAAYADDLIHQNHARELTWVRGLIHNGIGMYAMWTVVASHVNLSVVLTYSKPFLQDGTASCICIGILAALFVVYFILDNFVIDKHTRYLFTPYIVLIIALLGVIDRGFDKSRLSSILVAILLAVGAMCFLVKMVLVGIRSRENPEPLACGSVKMSQPLK